MTLHYATTTNQGKLETLQQALKNCPVTLEQFAIHKFSLSIVTQHPSPFIC
ncbi:hypothetical protein QUF63_13055 [Anaerolineales bacterium HSG25]|nr:hypothetical protein [Anaerolineales bacterium HSG25]